MKKVFLVLLVLTVFGATAFASDLLSYPPPLRPGNILIDVGVGYAFATGSGASMVVPPLVLTVEYCLPVGVPISVGGLIGYYQWEWRGAGWVETWSYTTFGARANWNWNINLDWLNLYTGVFVGYTHFSWSANVAGSEIIAPNYGGVSIGGQAGARFFFSRNFGAVVELGFPFVAKAGLAIKF